MSIPVRTPESRPSADPSQPRWNGSIRSCIPGCWRSPATGTRNPAAPAPWPDTLDEWLRMCHDAGQDKPTAILLRYGQGDWNALRRDLYRGPRLPAAGRHQPERTRSRPYRRRVPAPCAAPPARSPAAPPRWCRHRGPPATAPRAAAKRTRRRHPLAPGIRRELRTAASLHGRAPSAREARACANPARPGRRRFESGEQRAWTKLSPARETWPRQDTGPHLRDGSTRKRPRRRDDPRLVSLACPCGRDRLRAEPRSPRRDGGHRRGPGSFRARGMMTGVRPRG
jgi:hypothetical protein